MPFDEDYGFITAEAFASGKPVLTCRDSGSPTELVQDGVSGRIVEPTADAVAGALAALAGDAALVETMGAAARARVASLTLARHGGAAARPARRRRAGKLDRPPWPPTARRSKPASPSR